MLFLLPDLLHPDEPVDIGSAYSALGALYDLARGELSKTVLHLISASEIANPQSSFQAAFIRDPLQALREMGAIVTGEREIVSLYRLRSVLPGTAGRIVTVAYPIWIAAAEL
jgi:hypothetical protein